MRYHDFESYAELARRLDLLAEGPRAALFSMQTELGWNYIPKSSSPCNVVCFDFMHCYFVFVHTQHSSWSHDALSDARGRVRGHA